MEGIPESHEVEESANHRERPEEEQVGPDHRPHLKRDLFIENILVRIHFIILIIRWTGRAPWEYEFPFPGILTSTILDR